MFRIDGDPDDRRCERDEYGDKQATADHHLPGSTPTRDSRPDTPELQRAGRHAHVGSRGGRELRRRWSVVYEAAHIHHRPGELCWVPVRRPSPPTNLTAVR